MSGVEFKEAQKSAQGTVDNTGSQRYTAHYQVRVSSPSDGPATVTQYARGNGVGYGEVFSYGNETDAGAFCDGVNVSRKPGSNEWWDVVATYGPPKSGQQHEDDDGQPSNDPDQWRWSVDTGYVGWQEPVYDAYNETAFPNPAQVDATAGVKYFRPVGTLGPVVNSANVVLDPPLMRDVFDFVLRFTTYSLTYDSSVSDSFIGILNDTDVSISDYLRSVHRFEETTFAQHTLKCTSCAATARVYEYNDSSRIRIPYWEWSWEFRYRPRWYGWLDAIVDRGITCFQSNTTLTAGTAPQVPVRDVDNTRVPELVLLDGKGYPLLPNDSNWDTGYYFYWRKDGRTDFTYPNLPFNFFKA
jgi:hypothetical protein